ncbi:MAG TPA: GH25 family lysozyme, partial [Polyangiaceae bacterium]
MTIFLNYRRDDSQSITGRIDDYLRATFGHGDVFRDIDSIPLGVDFVNHLEEALALCDVCIVVIGMRWLSERLDDRNDFVRLEIEAALTKEILVIPVLVEGARMPSHDKVPESIQGLLRRQALVVDSGSDFRTHVQRLVESIQRSRQIQARRAAAHPNPQQEQIKEQLTAKPRGPVESEQPRSLRAHNWSWVFAVGGGTVSLLAIAGLFLRFGTSSNSTIGEPSSAASTGKPVSAKVPDASGSASGGLRAPSLPTVSDTSSRVGSELRPAGYVPTHVQATATDQTARGVDASEHDKLDWDALQRQGVTFIFLRATYGSAKVDREFNSRWNEAKVRGIIRGAYHFYRVDQPPEDQANAFLSHVHLEPGDLPAVLDLETNPFAKSPASPDDIIFGMSNWLTRVESATGRKPIIYTGPKFSAETYKTMKSLSSYPLWIAYYGDQLSEPPVPRNWDTWTFWQYAGTPSDLNRFNGTADQLKQFAGKP